MAGQLAYAEVAEGVRRTIAAYTQALDDGRTDDVVATFCPDGQCDIPGLDRATGHAALREAYERVRPRRPQRHLVLNTLIPQWSDREATAVSDVVFLLSGRAGWRVQLVGRYTDTLRLTAGEWLFQQRTGEFIDDGRVERPPSPPAC